MTDATSSSAHDLDHDTVPVQGIRVQRTWLGLFVAAFGVLAYADMGNVLSSLSPLGSLAKLAYMAALSGAFLFFATGRRAFRRGFGAAWVLLAFTLVAAVAYAWQVVLGRSPNSYLAAFMPTILCSMILVLPEPSRSVDRRSLVDFLLTWLVALGAIYAIELGWRSARGELGDINNLENHVKSIALVVAAGIAMVSGKWRLLLAIGALSLWTTLLRPSSTFILAMVACTGIAVLMRANRTRAAALACYATLAALAISPFVVTYFPGAGDLVLGIEGALKEDVLGGETNTAVRLTIQTAALTGLEGFDWLFGQAFTGATSVYVADMLPWWWDNSELGVATIHSDYVIMFVQSGLLGYVAYNLALAALCGVGLKRRPTGEAGELTLRAIFPICVIALAVYSAANPFLQYYQISHVIWACLGLAQYALIGRATGPRQSEVY